MEQFKNSNFDNSEISNWDKTQTEHMTIQKIKLRQNPNFEKTLKLKLWQNSKTQFVTKHNSYCDTTQNSNCDNSNSNKTQKLKKQPNSKTWIVMKPKNWNSERKKSKTQVLTNKILTKLIQSFGKNSLTPQQLMRCTLGSVLQSCNVFL